MAVVERPGVCAGLSHWKVFSHTVPTDPHNRCEVCGSAPLSGRLEPRGVDLSEVTPLTFRPPEDRPPTASQAVTCRLRPTAGLCLRVFPGEEQSVE